MLVEDGHEERKNARRRKKMQSVWWVVFAVVLVAVVVMAVVIGSYLGSQAVSRFARWMADPGMTSAKLGHITAWCRKPDQCDPDTRKAWNYYFNAGRKSAENYMTVCDFHRASDSDGGTAYRDCLKKREAALSEPGFDRRTMLTWLNVNATGVCDGLEYDVVQMLSTCPYDEGQRRIAEPLYTRADMVCMRPNGDVLPLHVGDRDLMGRRSQCAGCEKACASDWKGWDCCEQKCADLSSDINNCGTCGTMCNASMEKCVSGKCMQVMWDTCNCGAANVRCGYQQMCYKQQCVDPLTDSDAKHAREMLQCHEKDETRMPPPDFSYRAWQVSENGVEKTYFEVMDKKHVSLALHKSKREPVDSAFKGPDAESGSTWNIFKS